MSEFVDQEFITKMQLRSARIIWRGAGRLRRTSDCVEMDRGIADAFSVARSTTALLLEAMTLLMLGILR
ncbi:hypothetical protein [Plasticicumulans sp.]|uniref:hypothetical protein n=1 Tax=Plasticicumulans sp. TaxID=2307179 RepID=UPI0039442705